MANIITDEIIDYVGILAKLELSLEEREEAKKDMGRMLDYIDMLNQLDTSILPISFFAASFSSEESSSLAKIPTYSMVSSLIVFAMIFLSF